MATATVRHFSYPASGFVFQPGTAHRWRWGPWPFSGKGVLVTAHPFDLSTANRALTVTDVELHTTPNQPVGDKWLHATVRNVGQDTIGIYTVILVVVSTP